MAKTLRVRTRTGWVTKPAADTNENRLLAEEVDDNFLALEDAISAINAFEIGYTMLAAARVDMPGWLDMDGSTYSATEYPDLNDLLGGYVLFDTIVPGIPTLANDSEGLAFSPDGRYLATGTNTSPRIQVIDLTGPSLVAGTPTPSTAARSLVYAVDGTTLLASQTSSPYLRAYDTTTWGLVGGTPTLSGICRGLAASPDGKYIAATHDGGTGLTVLDTSDWSVVAGTPSLGANGYAVSFSPDSAQLAVSDFGGGLTVLDVSNWSVVPGTPTPVATVVTLDYSANGGMLATGLGAGGSPFIVVYNTSDWSTVSGTPTESEQVNGVRFSAYGDYFAYYSLNGSVRVYDTATWTLLPGTTPTAITKSMEFGPDNQYLAAGTSATSVGLKVIPVEDPTKFSVPATSAPRADLVWRIKAE